MALGERGRNPFIPRSTAEGVCALRAAGALERDPTLRCPDDMAAGFLGGFNTTTLAKFRATRGVIVKGFNRKIPGAYPYEIMRAKFIDEVVLGEAALGLDQLIVLGAGFDSRPYRLADRLRGVRVFEVDHPATQASKRVRLRRLMGEEPAGVTFVAVDFTRDDTEAELQAAGHDRSARTLVVWCGVSPYLPEEAVGRVLAWVGRHQSPRTSIVFDALWAGAVDGSRNYDGAVKLRKALSETGECLCWGIPEGRVGETLSRYGLQVEREVGPQEGRATYLRRSDGTLFDPPYGFGVLIQARVTRPVTSLKASIGFGHNEPGGGP
jgi:methyltransferase (TIGR00027 family)